MYEIFQKKKITHMNKTNFLMEHLLKFSVPKYTSDCNILRKIDLLPRNCENNPSRFLERLLLKMLTSV